jgi:hypothetical protein
MSVIRHKTFRFKMWDMTWGRPRVSWPESPRPWGFWDWLSMGVSAPPTPYQRLLGRVEGFVNEVGAENIVSINETNVGFGAMVTVWYRVESEATHKPYKATMAEL